MSEALSTSEVRKTLWETLATTVQESIMTPAKWNQYENISPQHIPIFLYRVQGFTQSEIAELTGFGRGTVAQVLRSGAGVRLLSELYTEIGIHGSEDVASKIKAAAHEALDTVIDVMRTGDDTLRMKSAMGILDRAGYGAVQKSETVVKVEISNERADRLNSALAEAFALGEGEFEIVEVESPAEPASEE